METLRYVGLDVHKESVVIAVADGGRGEPAVLATIPNDTRQLVKRLGKLGPVGTLRCCYEAGPTGFGLYRELAAHGIACDVVAPGLVPVQTGTRIKTDRRDAVRLARFHRSGDLTAIYVPDEATEAMRDLERARDDAKKAERVTRHQLGKFLLRHGRLYPGKTAWTKSHLAWIQTQQFTEAAQQRVLVDYVHAVEEATARVERLTKDLGELCERWSQAPLVKALQALRGVKLVTAAIIAAELGDLRRFARPPQLMAFLGLVPSEHSSGDDKHRGRITRTGNGHVRRVLTEAAWAYRYRPARSSEMQARSQGVALGVQRIAWKAQHRLHGRYLKLMGRGKNKQQTVTAIARELAGFIWAIGREPELLAAVA
jgi:transposase